MELFQTKTGEAFDWKAFQKFMGYSDEEISRLKADPRKLNYVQKVTSEDFRNKYIVCEVIESHGCEAGMKVGDRLYLEGMYNVDPSRSDPFCIYAMNHIHAFANGFRTYYLHGFEPNDINMLYTGCMDTESTYGLGRVKIKMTLVDKKDLDNF